MEEKDLSLPENNDFIPQDGPDPEVNANPFVPESLKEDDPHFAEKIMEQLSTGEIARVGEDLILQRRHLHEDGQSGGENFKLSDTSGKEIIVTLPQIAKVRSEKDLRALLGEDK